MGMTSSDAVHGPASGYLSTGQSLHEASEALREHLLCHLSLPTLTTLSQASTEWHQLILPTPLPQLSAHVRELLLPKGMSSQQSLRETLQERGSLMAELRRHSSSSHEICNHQICDQIMKPHRGYRCCKDVYWSPQPDISKPSQYIFLFRQQTWLSGSHSYESIATVLDLHVGRPVEFQLAVCGLLMERASAEAASSRSDVTSEQMSLSSSQCMQAQHVNIRSTGAVWTADGQHLVIKDQDLHINKKLMLADLAEHTITLICQAHGYEYFLVSPAGTMWTLFEKRPSDLNVYHIPGCELHFSVGIPDTVDILPPAEWLIRQVCWSPDGSKLAVTWYRDRRPCREQVRPCVAMYRAHDGACLTSIILPPYRYYVSVAREDEDDDVKLDDDDDNFYGEPDLELQWGFCSSYLLCQQADKIACITPLRGYAWCSSTMQRNPENMALSRADVTMAPSGRYLCVVDEPTIGDHVLSMLDAIDGKVMAAWRLGPTAGCSPMVWAADSDVCHSTPHKDTDSFVLIPAAADSTSAWPANTEFQTVFWGPSLATHSQPTRTHDSAASDPSGLAWHVLVLVAPGPTCETSETNGSFFKFLKVSPCRTVVTGAWQHPGDDFPDQTFRSRAELSHWHLPRATSNLRIPIRADNLRLHVQPQKCAALLLPRAPISRVSRLAWHPQPNACLYACYSWQEGLCLVNAKSNGIVRSWTLAELAGHILEYSDTTDSMDGERPQLQPRSALEWSHDGCRLAVLMGQHCAVLEF